MIYLIRTYGKNGESILKIGFASDLERRMSQYFYANPLFEFVSSREGDELLEKLLHYYLYYKRFQYKVDGKLNEWFIDDPEVIKIFDISMEDLEKELWENRDKVFDLKGKLKNSLDYKLFEYLYQKNKEDFIGEKYILDENNKVIETSAKDIDIVFWKKYYYENSIIYPFNANPDEEIEKEVNIFLNYYFLKTGLFAERLKLYCEFMDKYKEDQRVSNLLNSMIKDPDFQKFYDFYGNSGCKAKKYLRLDLEKGIVDNTEDKQSKLILELDKYFKPSLKYTLKDIKNSLKIIYDELGVSNSPKASDIENYFEIKPILIQNKETKKRDKGYLIISKKVI